MLEIFHVFFHSNRTGNGHYLNHYIQGMIQKHIRSKTQKRPINSRIALKRTTRKQEEIGKTPK
jgi:hypothetical protein